MEKSPPALRRRVTLRQLELLAAFERAASLSAAAHEVHLTQPAASKLLSALVSDLGVQLFERAGRALRPTAAGRALVRRAAALMGDLDRSQAELAAIRDGLAGSVTLGAGVGACYHLVPEALGRLLAEAPGIAVGLRDGPVAELLALLREGRLDLVVARVDATLIGRHDVAEALYDPPMRIVSGPQHPLARRARVAWPALLKEEWILPQASTPMRDAVEGLFRRANGRPEHCHVESSSIPANVALLGKRNMLWPLSADIAAGYARAGMLKVLRVAGLHGAGAVMIVHAKGRALLPAALRLVGCLRATSRDAARLYR